LNRVFAVQRTDGIWGDPILVDDGATVDQESPKLTLGADGAVKMAWQEETDIRSSVLRRGAWSSPIKLPGTYQSLVALSTDETGTAFAVAESLDRLGVSVEAKGDTWATPIQIVPPGAFVPSTYRRRATGAGVAVGTTAIVRFGSPPSAPLGVTSEGRDRSIAVGWTPPARTGAPITGYTATAEPGGASCTTTATSCTLTGLGVASSYRVTVSAENAFGRGTASQPIAVWTETPAPATGKIRVVSRSGTTTIIDVPVTVPAPGEITLTGTTPPAQPRARAASRKPVWRCTTRATFRKAGAKVMRCTLRSGARQALKRGALRFRFHVVFDPASRGPASDSSIVATIPKNGGRTSR
jgi:hypothetical protein